MKGVIDGMTEGGAAEISGAAEALCIGRSGVLGGSGAASPPPAAGALSSLSSTFILWSAPITASVSTPLVFCSEDGHGLILRLFRRHVGAAEWEHMLAR